MITHEKSNFLTLYKICFLDFQGQPSRDVDSDALVLVGTLAPIFKQRWFYRSLLLPETKILSNESLKQDVVVIYYFCWFRLYEVDQNGNEGLNEVKWGEMDRDWMMSNL